MQMIIKIIILIDAFVRFVHQLEFYTKIILGISNVSLIKIKKCFNLQINIQLHFFFCFAPFHQLTLQLYKKREIPDINTFCNAIFFLLYIFTLLKET